MNHNELIFCFEVYIFVLKLEVSELIRFKKGSFGIFCIKVFKKI